jgi:uncharacterized protein
VNDVFADTAGWAHLLDASQEHHALAGSIYQSVRQNNRRFVTTNYVLTELVALFTSPLRLPRTQVIAMMNGLKSSRFVRIVHVHETLDAQAWELLSNRQDKTWSLVDCSSFAVMQREGLTDALTTDHHFGQAGFVALLKPGS